MDILKLTREAGFSEAVLGSPFIARFADLVLEEAAQKCDWLANNYGTERYEFAAAIRAMKGAK